MMNPLLLLGALGLGYYFYTRGGSAAAPTGESLGWSVVDAKSPYSAATLDVLAANSAKPEGVAVRFDAKKDPYSASVTAKVLEVQKIGTERVWKVAVVSTADDATAVLAGKQIPVGAIFFLKDNQLA